MKPSWDTLAEEHAGSQKVLIADVDCTAAGEPLCERFGVEGFPTIKYFSPPDQEGEDYEGGRDLDDLRSFAASLGPGCSPTMRDQCSAEQLEELEALLKVPEAEREAELATLKADIAAKEKAHEALLETLQAQYEESNKALEAAKKASAPRIKQLKLVGTKVAEPEPEPKEEL